MLKVYKKKKKKADYKNIAQYNKFNLTTIYQLQV